MTWKVRRIGHGLWSSVHTTQRTAWSWIERVQRMAPPPTSITAGAEAPSTQPTVFDGPHVTGDAHQWLTALRLDRAAAALADAG